MAQRTYTVTAGQQYDPWGASVECDGLRTAYRANGRYDAGRLPRVEDLAAVEAAVARVIATRQAETITVGTPAQPMTAEGRDAMTRHEELMERLEHDEYREG